MREGRAIARTSFIAGREKTIGNKLAASYDEEWFVDEFFFEIDCASQLHIIFSVFGSFAATSFLCLVT
jgi:hypothetical protein